MMPEAREKGYMKTRNMENNVATRTNEFVRGTPANKIMLVSFFTAAIRKCAVLFFLFLSNGDSK